MHQQCEGMSNAIFQSPEQQIALRAGADEPGDVRYVERLIRSCPMGALKLDMAIVGKSFREAPESLR
ncbi:hypothetical protein OG315_07280 [Streptomyces atratus]|nr:hypothetical protein [Streptomyces atratus]